MYTKKTALKTIEEANKCFARCRLVHSQGESNPSFFEIDKDKLRVVIEPYDEEEEIINFWVSEDRNTVIIG